MCELSCGNCKCAGMMIERSLGVKSSIQNQKIPPAFKNHFGEQLLPQSNPQYCL